jgi:16S rRNA (guanine527-N7)-methyltransferase
VSAAHPTTLPPAPPEAADAFGAALPLAVRYADMLCREGVERGLIGPREQERIWTRHLLNSVVLTNWLPTGATVADVGSGAGLPGIPLALARPDLFVTLVEPMARRVEFLEEVRAALGLSVVIERARAEQLAGRRFDAVVARAVAPLPRLLEVVAPMVRPGGTLLALKGSSAATEVESARPLLADLGGQIELLQVAAGGQMTHLVRVRLDTPPPQGPERLTARPRRREDATRGGRTGSRRKRAKPPAVNPESVDEA